jgi:hypothetical protein
LLPSFAFAASASCLSVWGAILASASAIAFDPLVSFITATLVVINCDFSVVLVGVVLDKTVLLGDVMVVVAAAVVSTGDDMQSNLDHYSLAQLSGTLRSLADLLPFKTRLEASFFFPNLYCVCGDGTSNGRQAAVSTVSKDREMRRCGQDRYRRKRHGFLAILFLMREVAKRKI